MSLSESHLGYSPGRGTVAEPLDRSSRGNPPSIRDADYPSRKNSSAQTSTCAHIGRWLCHALPARRGDKQVETRTGHKDQNHATARRLPGPRVLYDPWCASRAARASSSVGAGIARLGSCRILPFDLSQRLSPAIGRPATRERREVRRSSDIAPLCSVAMSIPAEARGPPTAFGGHGAIHGIAKKFVLAQPERTHKLWTKSSMRVTPPDHHTARELETRHPRRPGAHIGRARPVGKDGVAKEEASKIPSLPRWRKDRVEAH